MSDSGALEGDQLDGAPHPRETARLFGHEAAERALLDAYRSGRMHHAWIISGEEGVGKATLAYRLARFILAHPDPASETVVNAQNLAVDPDVPAARRIVHQAHPDLFVLRRGPTKDGRTLMSEISVHEARRLISFFTSTAGEGGWRIAIVDTADELNTQAANALLKVLEEPPPNSLILILAAAPKRLLATLRSRCRTLTLKPLATDEVFDVLRTLPELTDEASEDELRRVAEASEGSVRRAAALLSSNSLTMRDVVSGMLERLPNLDHAEIHALADRMAGRAGEQSFALMLGFIQDWLHAQLTAGAAKKDARLAAWAALWEKTARTAREAEIYNLDRRPLVLAIFSDLAAIGRG